MPKIIAQKEDWIKLGYRLFAESGFAGLVIEKMAKKLACNKSSFYWHFKTKKEFLDRVVDYWVGLETGQIIAVTNREHAPKERFEVLVALAFRQKPYLDFIFYLKRYGQKDKKIQVLIDQIDAERVMFVTDLLAELGYEREVAGVKAGLFYKYLIGYHELMRYKKQGDNFLTEVLVELGHFIKY
ncbi:MAG TPA: TetR/AcrR family transcriptional regulator [Bacteroidetes bacterium]|nr:TetR/AcrR family transcriptional regulator [Bacteroidota bacterium]